MNRWHCKIVYSCLFRCTHTHTHTHIYICFRFYNWICIRMPICIGGLDSSQDLGCSGVVVQLVDSRNPLLFRCEDLERYVKEVDPAKHNILLLNKADLLSPVQRCVCVCVCVCEWGAAMQGGTMLWWLCAFVSNINAHFLNRIPWEYREAWAQYFESIGVACIFFSAAQQRERFAPSTEDVRGAGLEREWGLN